MDIHMPGMDGIETTRRIRRHEAETRQKPCRIIAVTADALITDGQDSLDAGMNGHLHKPIKVPEIEWILSQLSEQKTNDLHL